MFGLAFVLFLCALGRDTVDRWVDATVLPPVIGSLSTEVRDRNIKLLRLYTVDEGRWRLSVTPDRVDPGYLAMLVDYEDKRFYKHSGVDLIAIIRAGAQAVWHGEVVSGASTLTMQTARLLEASGTGRLKGKLRQMRVALALERRFTKDQILKIYLERAPFGGSLEGVRAATLAWFGKEPTRLTDAEAALLVAIPQAPERRRPDRNGDAANASRDRVLDRTSRNGLITPEAALAARTEPVPHQRRAFPALAPHLADRAKSEAPERHRHELTIDANLQTKLEQLATKTVSNLPNSLSIAIVFADHGTGEILASVGSAGYESQDGRQGFVDMTQAVRSPGSTLKPLIYGLAFDRGLAHPQTLINDRPVQFGTYAPQNFDGAFHGELLVGDALRQSLNIPAVLLLDEVGPTHLVNAMRKSGTEAFLPSGAAGLAVGLGGVGVTLEGLAGLYAMLGNGGQAGHLFWRQGTVTSHASRVLSPSSAWHISNILQSIAPPVGAAADSLAYKTGTSYGHRDAWALGYDGAHVAGVWIGRPDGTPVPGAFGGDFAAPILFEAFQRLGKKTTPLAAPPPETLLLSTAQLPQPLRRFGGRNAIFEPEQDAPKLMFPPDGARLKGQNQQLVVKLRDGTPPFTWIANGKPTESKSHRRETVLQGLRRGFSTVSVVDAKGRSSSVTVWLD